MPRLARGRSNGSGGSTHERYPGSGATYLVVFAAYTVEGLH
jgi:hypothetical protein